MIFSNRNKIKELSDVELIGKYKKSENKIYIGELFDRYHHLVYGVCLKYLKNETESKDASLQVFENLFTDLLKHEVKNFSSWLHSVTRNHCLMFLRSKQRVSKHTERFKIEQQELNFEAQEDDVHIKEIRLTKLEDALQKLNPSQKQCVELFYLENKSYKEIVDITGFKLKNVKSYIQNGKRNLKISLGDEDEIAI